jgi:predicted RNA-binding protein YlxR (DUF448 family)
VIACDGGVILDEQHVMQGRGAYIHPELDCITKINQVGRWERALKVTSGSIRADVLAELAKRLISEVNRDLCEVGSGGLQGGCSLDQAASGGGPKKFRL